MILESFSSTRDHTVPHIRDSNQKPMHPSLILTNVRSLLPKIDELCVLASMLKPDIISLTETWLNSGVTDDLISIPGYIIFRTDRTSKRGGGTAMYIKDCHFSRSIDVTSDFPIEVDVTVVIFRNELIVICLYIPPDVNADVKQSTRDALCSFIDSFLTTNSYLDSVIILGDFNKFDTSSLCIDLDLFDIVSSPTRNDSVLDHVLVSNELSDVYNNDCVSYNSPISSSDHKTICVTPISKPANVNDYYCTVFDYRHSYMCNLYNDVCDSDWDNLYKEISVHKQCAIFYRILNNSIDKTIPRCTVKMTQRDKFWMTPLTKHLINEKWLAYRNGDWSYYNHMKVKVRTEIHKAKLLWANKSRSSSESMWSVVNHLTGRDNRKGLNGLIAQYPSVEMALTAMKQVFDTNASQTPTCTSDLQVRTLGAISDDDVWNLDFTEQDVYQYLSRLSVKSSMGSDLISNRVYRFLSNVLAKPLFHIFKTSILQREFPNMWKFGFISPIPKTQPAELSALRPITLLPSPSKIFERLILKSMQNDFVLAFGDNQHGFRSQASTTTALIEIDDTVTSFLDDSKMSGAIIVSADLSKAFDNVEHTLLLRKMHQQGFPTGFLKWLSSYLTLRTASLKVHSSFSSSFSQLRGVPQGSVLGPSLFCCYISDLTAMHDKTKMIKYADDVNLILPLVNKDADDLSKRCNEEIANVRNWCANNSLSLNNSKSKFMFVSQQPLSFYISLGLPQATKLTILGVTFNERWTWKDHVKSICMKASRRFYALRKVRNYISKEDLHVLYVMSIRSLVEYASPVFIKLSKSDEVCFQRLDRRAHRIINSSKSYACGKCDNTTIPERRKNISIKLFRKSENSSSHILHHLVPNRLHYSRHLRIPFCRTKRRRRSFFPYVTSLINDLI